MDAYESARTAFDSVRSLLYQHGSDPRFSLSPENEALARAGSLMAGHFPVRLYKYQKITSRNMLDVLAGRLHLSPVSMLNDVNEGRAKMNESTIEGWMRSVVARGYTDDDLEEATGILGARDVAEKALAEITETVESYPEEVARVASRARASGAETGENRVSVSSTGSLCETVLSANMWDRYADGHRGMAAAYDFQSMAVPCECSPGTECPMGVHGVLFPVEYRGSRPDLSMLLSKLYVTEKIKESPQIAHRIIGREAPPRCAMDLTMLISSLGHKSKEWEHEREWRVAAWRSCGYPTHVTAKPTALYVGAMASPSLSTWVVYVANKLGIDAYRMVADAESDDYSMKTVPLLVGAP